MKSFDYHTPQSMREAVVLLGALGDRACLLAGGTDLLVEMKENIKQPTDIVDLKHLPGLARLSFDPKTGLDIGAMVTVSQVAASDPVQRHYPALAYAAAKLGSPQVRNLATVAGNICRAAPSADTPPPLIAAGAKVCIFGPQGGREVRLEDFFTGPGQTVLSSDEILQSISVPCPEPHSGAAYIKHGRRKAMELAAVGVAASLTLDGEKCSRVRIVLGAVAPTPMRAGRAEKLLEHKAIDQAAIEAAAKLAMEESKPISDVRASAEYRRDMVGVLTNRALTRALAMAREA